jgi:plastocyanin
MIPCRAASFVVAVLALAALAAPPTDAGQVRVNVGSGGQFFSPYVVNINQGDQVVWVWIAGTHNVLNWTLPADSVNFNVDGTIFDSDPVGIGQGTTTRFTWKSDRTGLVPYVCNIHNNNMSGRIVIVPLTTPPTNPVADFRITEVQFNDPGGVDRIEISNLGQAAGDLRSYRLAVLGTGTGVVIINTDYPVPAGGRITVHNTTGTNTSSDLFLPGLGSLGDVSGSVALYAPYSFSPGNAVTNALMMLDFVQWGAGGQPNEGTANTASFWVPGTSINNVAPGHSIEYCQNATLSHGVTRWAEISPPNFGDYGDCTTPTMTQTWGHLKIIYRQ